MPRISKAYRLEERYVAMLEEMAKNEHRSLTNMLEISIEKNYKGENKMTLQEKIAELELQGWEYDDDFRMPSGQGNTLSQLTVVKKGNYYKSISGGKIGAEKQIMSDEMYEQMSDYKE